MKVRPVSKLKSGDRIRYRDGVIYQVQSDGSFRREGEGKMSKAERKAAKRDKVRRRDACATGVKA